MITTIEQMAKQVGLSLANDEKPLMEAFAQLVREAHTKELLAGVGESVAAYDSDYEYADNTGLIDYLVTNGVPLKKGDLLYTADQVAAAVLRERERIAEYVNRNLMSSGEYADAILEGRQQNEH